MLQRVQHLTYLSRPAITVALLDRRERHHAWAAEQVRDDHHVFTLDSDFTVYRKHGRKSLALIHPALGE